MSADQTPDVTREALKASLRDYAKEAAQKGHIDLERAVAVEDALTAHDAKEVVTGRGFRCDSSGP